jgi:hypothetical protein
MPVFATQGGTIRVYRFQVYDIVRDELVTSTRMASAPAIERIRAVRGAVSFEVPSEHLDSDGFTQKDYDPVQGAPS